MCMVKFNMGRGNEELKQLADFSHTNISINTKKLSVEATYLF